MIEPPCNKIYQGETSHPLKEQMNKHGCSIKRNDLTSPGTSHCNKKNIVARLYSL